MAVNVKITEDIKIKYSLIGTILQQREGNCQGLPTCTMQAECISMIFQTTLIPVVYTSKPTVSMNKQWKGEGKSIPSTTCLTFSSLKDNR